MNRDEKLDRFTALAPTVVDVDGRGAVFPREPTGGTWISANDTGVCFALINWHRVAEPASGGQLLPKERNWPGASEARSSSATQPVETTGCPSDAERIERERKHDLVSRGQIVRELAGKSSADEIADGVMKLPLRKLRPFRLIAVVPSEKIVIECRWNLEWLTMRNREWQRQHWFSSGFDESRAEVQRAKICASFAVPILRDDPGKRESSPPRERTGVNAAGHNLRWLRQLHCSHAPKRGPFSICMHREDAATVSYTEVSVSGRHGTMRYKPGPCCSNGATVTRTISLAR